MRRVGTAGSALSYRVARDTGRVPIPGVDRAALEAVAAVDGPARTGDVADRLGCTEAEADRRLRGLVQSGHIAGSWADEPWQDIEWEVLPRGRATLE